MTTLTEHRSISSLSLSTKSLREGMVNFWKQRSNIERFCVFIAKVGTKEKVHKSYLLKCFTSYDKLCNSLTCLAETKGSRNHVLQVKHLSEANFKESYGMQVRFLSTSAIFYAGSLSFLSGKNLSKPLKSTRIKLFLASYELLMKRCHLVPI